MKAGLTEMVFILDRSGSMHGLESETIGGFNSLIEKQKKEPGEAFVTTVLFDYEIRILHDHVNIEKIRPLTDADYFPRGSTALLDAVGTTINRIGERLARTPEEERPEQVVFVITTDGYENSSKEFSWPEVKSMIEHQQNKYSWLFMFLGANMNAVHEGGKLGISAAYSKTYTASSYGTAKLYSAVSNAISGARSYSEGNSVSTSYTTATNSAGQSLSREEAIRKVADALDEVE